MKDSKTSEKISSNKCAQCGGKCCKGMFISAANGGLKYNDLGFEEWC